VVGDAALELPEGADELWVAKGKRVERVDLTAERPDDAALLELLLGRSGKLRAPTLRTGARLLVGYNEELLSSALL